MKVRKPTACPDCGNDLIPAGPPSEAKIEGVPVKVRHYFCGGERTIWIFAAGEPIMSQHADDVYRWERIRLAHLRRGQEQGHTFEGVPHFSEWSPQLKMLSIEGEDLLDREKASEPSGTKRA